jgi:hypothetical protein
MNQQELYNSIKKTDGKTAWATCATVANLLRKQDKLIAQAQTYREGIELEREEQAKKKRDSLDSSSPESNLTDEELRLRVKNHLLVKLDDGSLSGSDIGQLKDIFGLASKVEELRIETVDYSNAIIDCPHCSTNIHAPVACLQRVDT